MSDASGSDGLAAGGSGDVFGLLDFLRLGAMTRFDWERAARKERVRAQGSEPAWLDVGTPRWKQQKGTTSKPRTTLRAGLSNAARRRKPKKQTRTGIVDAGGFDEIVWDVVRQSGGWVTISELVERVNEQRASGSVTEAQLRARIKARKARYVLDGDRVRLRKRLRRER